MFSVECFGESFSQIQLSGHPALFSQHYSHILRILRKEVIQPQVPLRLPCYDLVPIVELTFGACPSCELA